MSISIAPTSYSPFIVGSIYAIIGIFFILVIAIKFFFLSQNKQDNKNKKFYNESQSRVKQPYSVTNGCFTIYMLVFAIPFVLIFLLVWTTFVPLILNHIICIKTKTYETEILELNYKQETGRYKKSRKTYTIEYCNVWVKAWWKEIDPNKKIDINSKPPKTDDPLFLVRLLKWELPKESDYVQIEVNKTAFDKLRKGQKVYVHTRIGISGLEEIVHNEDSVTPIEPTK